MGTNDIETKVESVNAEEAPKTEGQPKQFIYLGPNRLRDGLQANQVYIGGVPEYAVKNLEGSFPLIRQLFAPIEEITEYQQKVQTKGTPQCIAYAQMLGVNE